MVEQITETLVNLNKEAAVVILAALPIAELRGAIPLGIAMDFSPVKTYLLAYFGNLLPVIPIYFLMQPFVERFRHIKFVERFFNWFFERTKKKAALIERFEAVGLILFVAIPLPVTGAWTGTAAATLFKIRFRYAFPAVAAGIMLAGFIVLGLTLAGKEFFGM